jgi:pilus assembly protein CpaB
MRRGRIFIYIAILLLLGALAVVLVLPRLNPPPPTPTADVAGGETPAPIEPTDIVEVVVVAQAIPLGTIITEDLLTMAPYPREALSEGLYFTNIQEVVGSGDKRARYDLEPKLILNSSHLAPTIEEVARNTQPYAFLIEKGKVAVSIPISRLSSVSYAPRTGDHVNIIVTLKMVDLDQNFQTVLPNQTAAVLAPGPAVLLGFGTTDKESVGLNVGEQLRAITAQIVGGGSPSAVGRTETDAGLEQTLYIQGSESQRPRLVSQTLIQNVMVLQVGNFALPEQEKKAQQAAAGGEPTPTPTPEGVEAPAAPATELPTVITLVVSPQDAVTLNYLLYSGAELTLALRAADDDTIAQIQSVHLQFLLETYDIPFPVKLQAGIDPRVDEVEPPK